MKNKGSYSWITVALLWVVALLNYLDRQMISTMRPFMQRDFPELQAATNFGYLMAVFLWIYAFMSPFSGMIADRINRKSLIVGSLLVWSMITLLMGYSKSFSELYVLRALMGFSEALYIPAALSLIADFHTDKTRSLAIGIHMTGFYMGQALGGFGATMAAAYSWKTAFQYFGGFGILYAFVLLFLLKEKRAQPVAVDLPNDQLNLKQWFSGTGLLLQQISFWVLLFYFAAPSLPGWGIKNWLPTLIADNLGMNMSVAGPLSTISIAFSSLIGVVAGGMLSDRWVQHNIRGRIYVSSIGLGLTIPALILLGVGHSLWPLMAAALCFGFGYGMFDANNMPILCQIVSARHRATAYGFMNMAGVLAGALVTNFLGKSTDAGHLGRDFSLLAFVVLAAIALQLSLLKPVAQNYPDVN